MNTAAPATLGAAPADTVQRDPAERLRRDQARRLQMIGVSATNYLTAGAVLALYAWVGTVGWSVPLAYVGIALLGSLGFMVAVRSGLNLRSREPNLFLWQMVFAAAIAFGFLGFVPGLAFMFLTSLFITAVFGLVQFSVRQFVVAASVVSAGLALLFPFIWHELALPASTPAEAAILWIYLVSALSRFVAVGAHVGALRGKLKEKNELLQQSVERIQELADHDELTGVLARRRFMQVVEGEFVRSARSREPFCVALLDLDHFKQVNDRHGHLVGDEVLRRFCAIVRQTVRASDQLGRYGGEEFALLLLALPPASAPPLMARITAAVQAHDWAGIAPELQVTVSVGVAAAGAGDTVATLLARADAALYAAKAGGRNRSEFAFDLPA